jgi:hypothetical protein
LRDGGLILLALTFKNHLLVRPHKRTAINLVLKAIDGLLTEFWLYRQSYNL